VTAKRTVGIDRAMALVPTSAEFIGLVVAEVGRVARGAFADASKMPSIEIEGHGPVRTVIFVARRLPTGSAATRYLIENEMAERQGFEPWLEFPLNTLSKRAPSATRPSLRAR
jgi:hypothetical protein